MIERQDQASNAIVWLDRIAQDVSHERVGQDVRQAVHQFIRDIARVNVDGCEPERHERRTRARGSLTPRARRLRRGSAHLARPGRTQPAPYCRAADFKLAADCTYGEIAGTDGVEVRFGHRFTVTTQLHTLGLCPLETGLHPLPDEVALELGDHREPLEE